MSKVFDFRQQLAAGATGEQTLDAFFSQWFEITPATDEQQRRGIDRWFVSKINGDRWAVEYKTDYVAQRTHNAFIETVSVSGQRAGWVHTSQAQWVMYYVPGDEDELVYMLDLSHIRRMALPDWQSHYSVASVDNGRYVTKGLIVPLVELEKHASQVCSL